MPRAELGGKLSSLLSEAPSPGQSGALSISSLFNGLFETCSSMPAVHQVVGLGRMVTKQTSVVTGWGQGKGPEARKSLMGEMWLPRHRWREVDMGGSLETL